MRFEDRNGMYVEKNNGDFYQEVMRFRNALLKLGIKKGIMFTRSAISEEALIAHCRERLAKFKVPDRIEFVIDFPRTLVGKIQKHVLRNAVFR
ncbi:hypothetical protein ABNX05_00385 [Lysinibacillus sp. M3]|uniref:AMP-binding enzyme C-terminal domain-containing protein n=1 Tax=Lysinibacillus zambalensis TaxID=3160866 RepID=A0ABV1MKP8_9BACI